VFVLLVVFLKKTPSTAPNHIEDGLVVNLFVRNRHTKPFLTNQLEDVFLLLGAFRSVLLRV
jgi:hypothetical protein